MNRIEKLQVGIKVYIIVKYEKNTELPQGNTLKWCKTKSRQLPAKPT